MTYDYHGFNEPVVIEPPERWEEGPLPTATPGQSFRATLGFRPEPQELTDAQWAELAAAVRDLLHDAGHTQASVRLLDNMLWVDAPYTREQAAELARLVREGPLPFPLELRAEGFGYTGSP